MRVTFRSKRDSYSVDARYRLFNTGKTVTVTVGVPKYGRPDRDKQWPKPIIVRDFISFDAWVNGRKAEFVEARDFFTDPSARPIGGYCWNKPAETRWMTKRVTFKGKATTVIRVRYEAHYHNQNKVGSGLVDLGYYHDSTGRSWKDKIKKAVFVSDVMDIQGDGFRSLGLVAFTDFISMSEVLQWEPSSTSYHRIYGSLAGAKWRGTRHRVGGPRAPTPCAGSR
jgi:hypothetical protein